MHALRWLVAAVGGVGAVLVENIKNVSILNEQRNEKREEQREEQSGRNHHIITLNKRMGLGICVTTCQRGDTD